MRFVVVGGVNTLISLLAFAVFDQALGIHYMGALMLSYAVGIVTGFLMHRRFVFAVRGNVLVDFLRFTSVNLGGLAANAALLPVFVEVVHLPAIVAQVIATGVVTVGSYFGHLLFSFRRPAHARSGGAPSTSG
jgi:putative flippase GtrA